jgi:hypothetical protein
MKALLLVLAAALLVSCRSTDKTTIIIRDASRGDCGDPDSVVIEGSAMPVDCQATPDGDIDLSLESAAVEVRVELADDVRCAVIQRGSCVQDFAVRPGVTSRVAVPPGDSVLLLYDGGGVRYVRELHLEAGASKDVAWWAPTTGH